MDRIIELAARDRLELRRTAGTRLTVMRGRIWLTQEGDPEDHVLGAGDAWTLPTAALALAEAQELTTVVLAGAAGVTARPFAARGTALKRAWRSWLRAIERRALPQM